MFDPVERDLYDLYLAQEEQMERESLIEEAADVFLGEAFEMKEFLAFMEGKTPLLYDLKRGLLESAEVEEECVRFWARSPEEFVAAVMSDYA